MLICLMRGADSVCGSATGLTQRSAGLFGLVLTFV